VPKLASYLLSIKSKSLFLVYSRDAINVYAHSQQGFTNRLAIFLRYHYNTRCLYLSDIICSDYPHKKMRFQLSYNFYSILYNVRILLSTYVDDVAGIFSLTRVFPASNWMEREIYDLFGIRFRSHPDMRRILTDYGFSGNPLRKDYPLTGYIEVHYDANYQCVMWNNVNLIQYFRNFTFDDVWAFNHV
jgi:NADH:ubiquinone oxidoreductase subunit C